MLVSTYVLCLPTNLIVLYRYTVLNVKHADLSQGRIHTFFLQIWVSPCSRTAQDFWVPGSSTENAIPPCLVMIQPPPLPSFFLLQIPGFEKKEGNDVWEEVWWNRECSSTLPLLVSFHCPFQSQGTADGGVGREGELVHTWKPLSSCHLSWLSWFASWMGWPLHDTAMWLIPQEYLLWLGILEFREF